MAKKRVRKHTKTGSLDAAVKRAVDECIQEGILKDFLQENREEVIATSIFEYNVEMMKEKIKD